MRLKSRFFACISFSCVPDYCVIVTYIFQNIPGNFCGDSELLKVLKISMEWVFQTRKIPCDENIKLSLYQESQELIHEKTGLKNPMTLSRYIFSPNFVLRFWRKKNYISCFPWYTVILITLGTVDEPPCSRKVLFI